MHKERPPQKAVFTVDDFEGFDEDAKHEAIVRVEAIGAENVPHIDSEGIVIEFGQSDKEVSLASGQTVRALVEGLITRPTVEEFDEAAAIAHQKPQSTEKRIADQMKTLPRYRAVFLGEGRTRPIIIALADRPSAG